MGETTFTSTGDRRISEASTVGESSLINEVCPHPYYLGLWVFITIPYGTGKLTHGSLDSTWIFQRRHMAHAPRLVTRRFLANPASPSKGCTKSKFIRLQHWMSGRIRTFPVDFNLLFRSNDQYIYMLTPPPWSTPMMVHHCYKVYGHKSRPFFMSNKLN